MSDNSTPTAYPVKRYPFDTVRYVRTLTLRPDSRLRDEYIRRHQPDSIWPEIVEGIRSVGVLGMDIFISGYNLTMIVEAPADFDWKKAMGRLATLPRQQEWEDFMAVFQQAEAGASPAEKWQPMQQMFHLYDDKELKR